MNKNLVHALWFVTGAAVGSVATWQIVKVKYEQIAQEEINSVKERYAKRKEELESKAETKSVSEKETYESIIKEEYISDEDYIDDEDVEEEEEELVSLIDEPENPYANYDRPYVIAPEEFGEIGYEEISLTFYADQILADDQDELVDDVDEIIGLESLTHFGEYEDDSVFVRNDTLRCDYEILKDLRKYSTVKRKHKST